MGAALVVGGMTSRPISAFTKRVLPAPCGPSTASTMGWSRSSISRSTSTAVDSSDGVARHDAVQPAQNLPQIGDLALADLGEHGDGLGPTLLRLDAVVLTPRSKCRHADGQKTGRRARHRRAAHVGRRDHGDGGHGPRPAAPRGERRRLGVSA
jgi:hypothetical protein